MHITSAPLLQHLLFEQPWSLFIALLCGAAILRVIAKGRNSKNINYVVISLIFSAIAVVIISFAIQTPREKLIAKTQKLVKATAPLDMSILQKNINPNVAIVTPENNIIGIFSEFKSAIKSYKIAKQSLRGLNAQAKAGKGLSKFTATTTFSQAQIPVRSKWALAWKQDNSGKWRVTKIYWLKLNRHDPPKNIPNIKSRHAFP